MPGVGMTCKPDIKSSQVQSILYRKGNVSKKISEASNNIIFIILCFVLPVSKRWMLMHNDISNKTDFLTIVVFTANYQKIASAVCVIKIEKHIVI